MAGQTLLQTEGRRVPEFNGIIITRAHNVPINNIIHHKSIINSLLFIWTIYHPSHVIVMSSDSLKLLQAFSKIHSHSSIPTTTDQLLILFIINRIADLIRMPDLQLQVILKSICLPDVNLGFYTGTDDVLIIMRELSVLNFTLMSRQYLIHLLGLEVEDRYVMGGGIHYYQLCPALIEVQMVHLFGFSVEHCLGVFLQVEQTDDPGGTTLS